MNFASLLRSWQAVLFIGSLLLTVSPALYAQTTLTFGGSDAVGSLLDRANKRFSDTVTERAAGKLKINFIQGEQLGNDMQVIEQMMQGSVHLYGDVLGWYSNWVKDFAILNWGFTFRDNDHMATFLASETYRALAEELRKEQGIRILAAAPTQPRVLFAKRAVNTPADLEGIKMRVPEIRTYLLLWETLGTRPSRVAWAEIFLGLKTGTIEAAEGPVSAAYAQKIHQAVGHVIRTDHLISTYDIAINDAAYQKLSPDMQKLLTDVAIDTTGWARLEAQRETEDLVAKMVTEGAVEIKLDRGPFAAKAQAGVQKMEDDGEWSKGLWEAIRGL